MRIVLNGESCEAAENCTLSELIAALKFDPNRIAVEVNQRIVPRAQHSTYQLNEDDRLEVVTFVGGG